MSISKKHGINVCSGPVLIIIDLEVDSDMIKETMKEVFLGMVFDGYGIILSVEAAERDSE